MSRREVREGLVAQMRGASVDTLLGPVSTANFRIYAGWPMVQPVLGQPSEADEGWLTFHERGHPFGIGSAVREDFLYEFNVFATSFTLGEDVLDILDGLWHYKQAGHNSCVFGVDRNVVWSQRVQTADLFDEARKLNRKMATYLYRTVKIPFRSGA